MGFEFLILNVHALHHICIITIFSCILDMCYICWTICVLLGLDWVEPMMYLNLHDTCSWIFIHMYLTVFFLWILNYLVLFWLSLSLSLLSLSYVSCIMAPKHKSTLSQNPLHSKASSSSSPFNPTPSHVRFHDEKAKLDFLENFSQWGIHSERQVILLDFSDTNLPTFIYSRV